MKEKTIKIPIFNDKITLLYGTEEEIYNTFIERFPDLENEYDAFYAKYWSIIDNGDILKYLLVIKDEGEEFIYHESLHATNDILHHTGVKVSNDNDEIQCRLMDYIAKKITKKINSWIKMKDTEQMTS
jgi:hypothetical protein